MTAPSFVAAKTALETGDPEQALVHARTAVAETGDVKAHLLVAEALLTLERWEDAISAADDAIRLAPTSHEAYRMRCVALDNLQRHEEMVATARRAVEVAPGEANAHYFLGRALWQTDRDAEARAAFEQAIAIEPLVPLYRVKLAELVFDSDPEAAEALLRRVVDDEPTRAEALNDLGVLVERRGDVSAARELYGRAQRADPASPAALHNHRRTLGDTAGRSVALTAIVTIGAPLVIAFLTVVFRGSRAVALGAFTAAIAGGFLTARLGRGLRRLRQRETVGPLPSFRA